MLNADDNPLKWQRSGDNEQSWTDIACTDFFYTEIDPLAGQYIYRALRSDATYSDYLHVDYFDAVPSAANTLPASPISKVVDDTVTLSLDIPDSHYSYQWYKGGTEVSGATGNTYSINGLKMADAGRYNCRIWNGCNSIYSEETMLIMEKSRQAIELPAAMAKTYGEDFDLPATTSKGLTIAYSSSNAGVATVSGSRVHIAGVGATTITATQAGNSDYIAAQTATLQLTVSKAAQQITFAALPQKTYGDAPFTLNATVSSELPIAYASSDPAVATVSGSTLTIVGAGEAYITASAAGNSSYLAADPQAQLLTVGKAAQQITFAALPEKTYGDAAFTLTATASSGLPVSYASSNPAVATVSGSTLTIVGAGEANITASVAESDVYLAAEPKQQLLTVGKAAQTISFEAIPAKTYGDSAFTLVALSSAETPVTFETAQPEKLAISGSTATILGTGAILVTAKSEGNSRYQAASTVRTFSVGKATLTVTAESKTREYGAANPALTYACSGFVNGETAAVLTAQPTVACSATAASDAGEYPITPSGAAAQNYAFSYQSGTLTVTRRQLQVTPVDAQREYGSGNPAFRLSFSGFVNGDDEASIDVHPTAATTATPTSSVGTYSITCAGGSAASYSFAYSTGTLTVTKAPLTAIADSKSRTYGAGNPALTISYSGFKNADSHASLQQQPQASCTATQASAVGSYAITLAGGEAQNYALTLTNGTLTVTKAPVTVTAASASSVYGEKPPVFTCQYSGFVNGETAAVLTTQPTVACSATAASSVGSYPITPSGAAAQNYAFSYQNGTLTVTRRQLQVTPVDAQREYGRGNPAFRLSFDGFVNGDDAKSISAHPTAATTATPTSSVGTYSITCSGGSAASYSFVYGTGTLTVTKAPLTITAYSVVRAYGEPNPTFSLSCDGFRNGENERVLDVLPTATCTANEQSPSGSYQILLSGGRDNNYSYTLVNGTLTVGTSTGSTGVDDVSAGGIALYPNPVQSELFIRSEAEVSRVEVFGLDGRLLVSQQVAGGMLSLQGLPKGVYVVKVHTERGIFTGKIVKNN